MMIECTNKIAITWIQCCERATERNYKTVKRALTVADWYLQLHECESLQFRRSDRGRQSSIARYPFAEDELLTMQFKSWARQDLEHLNITKSQDFINTKLLADWTCEQLRVNRISFPVSQHVVSRWMKEAGFSYETHKKSYYVDRHEDLDVVRDRRTYLDIFFKYEINEHCWVQLTKRKYLTLKHTNAFQTLKIKQEKDIDVDMVAKTNDYIDKYCTHYYTTSIVGEDVDMV